MIQPSPDDRSQARRESDERIAAEPRLPPLAVAPGQMAVPLETFIRRRADDGSTSLNAEPRSGIGFSILIQFRCVSGRERCTVGFIGPGNR